ncbi:MAG: PAS domain-containing protein [Hyphomicrobiales bacterium]|nr:MAG: PAS domain-containing protein [Hyphomicrobiales bacterium]
MIRVSAEGMARPRAEVLLLLGASLAVVAALLIAIFVGTPGAPSRGDSAFTLLLSFIASAIVMGGVFTFRAASSATVDHDAHREIAELRRNLVTVEAILKAEPQVLVYWEKGQSVRVMMHTLTGVAGLPWGEPELLRFGGWLDPPSGQELKTGLDALFRDGQPFTILLRTAAGAHVEADGRAAGGRAILRLRDVAGRKRDLARILDQHRQLVRDTVAGRKLLNALPMPAWFRGADGRIEWVNDAYVKAVEASSEAEVRERQIELLEMRQRQAVRTSLSVDVAYRDRVHIISGGVRKAHEVVVLPLDAGSVGAAIDVTEIESAQDEIARHVGAYERTLDRVSTGVAIFGPDQRLTFFNEAYRKLWQLDADWLATHPSDGEILDRLREVSRLPEVQDYKGWKSKVLGGYVTGAEYDDWWHLLDGRTIHVTSARRPEGGIAYIYDDVTQKIELESRYNALIDVQRETLDHLEEGVALFATDGRLQLFNSAFAQIWKLPRSRLNEGPHIDEVIRQCLTLYADSATWARVGRAVTGISDRRQAIDGVMERPDDTYIEYAVSPLPDGATLITFVDVSDSKRYARTLTERNEALLAADTLKNQFISHVSYELRTPLQNVIGFSELLASPRTGELNAQQMDYLGVISSQSRSLLSIINDILDLATIDAGALELTLAPVQVRAVIDRSVEVVRDRLTASRLNLDIAVADDVVEFVADEARVRQVLYNLLSNAIGFSRPGGGVKIMVQREPGMVAFSVIDSGVGIPKERQAQVLGRFVSDGQGSKHRGAGLGLSIVKSLVELHGGTVELFSMPGYGTTVTVRFPEFGRAPDRLAHNTVASQSP